MISPAPPHWQLIGSEFALIPLYALLATTDPSVPPENYVTPLNPPIPGQAFIDSTLLLHHCV